MPKKAATARSRAQRNRPKVQKSFELVRPKSILTETEESILTEKDKNVSTDVEESSTLSAKAPTAMTKQEKSKASGRASTTDGRGQAPSLREESKPREERGAKTEEHLNTPAPRSASARLAARRQAAQRLQQRSATTLITSEHFAYVRQDLIKIAVFAVLMFTAIIVLYFTLGRA